MDRREQPEMANAGAGNAQQIQRGSLDTPFGRRRMADGLTPAGLLAAEQRSGRATRFHASDALIGRLLTQVLLGEQPIVAVDGDTRHRRARITDLSPSERQFLDETWSLARLQERGSWFVPERITLHVGQMQLPWLYRHRGPYAGTFVDEQKYAVAPAENADMVLMWAVIEPFCQTLFMPFALRGSEEGKHTREEVRALWAQIDALLNALGLQVSQETAILRYGSGWSKLRAAERREAKLRLLEALARRSTPDLAARLRALGVHALLTQYYAKAKGGFATRKQALTKALHPAFVAYFGGDWLAFLDYLGEQPHPDEAIITALPEPRLYVGGAAKAQEVAAELGLPESEVAQIAGSFWQTGNAHSPIEERTATLAEFWRVFDTLHARQAPGMPTLWGLVDDEGRPSLVRLLTPDTADTSPWQDIYEPRLYLQRFPPDLLARIHQLWGATVLPTHPERLVSEPFPHALLAETMGPALRFWHGCALTAWFLCEGPYSRTNMAGLAAYHARQLDALAERNTPIPAELFQELIQAEGRLGPPQAIVTSQTTQRIGPFAMTFTTSAGTRRAGFEQLRDIITRYRRAWTATYWDRYVRGLWERELRAASHVLNVALARDGRLPNPKYVAREALAPITHWFGGDASLLYSALGEVAPIHPVAHLRLVADPLDVAMRVRHGVIAAFPQLAEAERHARQQPDLAPLLAMVDRLAEQSLHYIQLAEALGRPPTTKEFGAARFREAETLLHLEADVVWERFAACVERALADIAGTPLY